MKSIAEKYNKEEESSLEQYIKFLNEKCKISFHTYADKHSNYLQWRNLTGSEKLKLVKTINLVQLFPDLPNADKIQEIWTEFNGIYKQLQSNDHLKANHLQDDVNNWILLFIKQNTLLPICAPYMHILMNHIPVYKTLW